MTVKNLRTLTVALMCSVLVTGCMTNEAGNLKKSNVGMAGGAVTGALLGSMVGKGQGRFLAIAAGGMVGALAGHTIGQKLDQADIAMHNQAQVEALEYNKTGQTRAWKNPDTGAKGAVTPVRTYRAERGRYCREYTQTIKVGGEVEKAYGTACRQPDGTWEVVK